MTKEELEYACSLLPEGAYWGDNITAQMALHIAQAARAIEREVIAAIRDAPSADAVDAQRWRHATYIAGNADILHSIVLCHEGDQEKINSRFDSYRFVTEPKGDGND